jgi:hypothetical protein
MIAATVGKGVGYGVSVLASLLVLVAVEWWGGGGRG